MCNGWRSRGLELCHLDGYDGALVALVAEAASGADECLLHVVGGEQAEDHGDVVCGVEACNALRDALTDVVEMGCLAADDAAEDDDGVIAVVESHLKSSIDELEGAGNSLHMDVLGQRAMLLEGAAATLKQGSGDFGVPLADDDAENHVRRIRHSGNVILRQVLCCHNGSCSLTSYLLHLTSLDVFVDGLILHGALVTVLDLLIELQGFVFLALALEDFASLDEEDG